MADNTKIEWTDATWNPVVGCSVVSPGCTNCYAMKLAGTRLRHHPTRAGLTDQTKAGPVWNGSVRFNEAELLKPLSWRRPRMIFVCAHGDLFHDSVPDAWIDRVFAVAALAPQHTLQVLTKRSERMRRYACDPATPYRVARAILDLVIAQPVLLHVTPWPVISEGDVDDPSDVRAVWPLTNVWLGVSAEDQRRADERIPDLLGTPAAVRFVSAEPLLGPLDLAEWTVCSNAREGLSMDSETGAYECCPGCDWTGVQAGIDWVIVGGESGHGARPMHPDWARSLRDQCTAAGVAFFFKQWGEWHPMGQTMADGTHNCMEKGERLGLWDPQTLSVKVGKIKAGRLLDGVQHDGMPTP